MIYVLNTELFDDSFTDKIRKAEKKYFNSCRITGQNRLSLYGRALLGYVLENYYGIDSFSYRYGKNGKPYLKDRNIYFSISHSGNYVLCCVSDKEIGCDIEQIKNYNPKIGKRFFTEKEAELLNFEADKDRAFARLWTLKESILKKEGTGITGGLDTYCFADFVCEKQFTAYGYNFSVWDYDDYMISVCSEYKESETETVSAEKITEFIGSLN